MSKNLYIIDAHSHIYAAFYALRNLSSPAGEPTNATFGFLGTVLKLIKTRNPDILAVAMDSEGPTFRHEQFAQYKANRPAMPEDLACQVVRIRQIVEMLHIPVLAQNGYEADDMIASLCKQAHAAGLQVFICSKDKDFEQILGPKVAMYDVKTDTVLDAQALLENRGLTPAQAAEVLALTGDSADNIPGVPGIGPVKATALIREYGSLENLLTHAHEVPGVLGQNLVENLRTVRTAQKLIALRDDAEVNTALNGQNYHQPPDPQLKQVLRELGFNKYLAAVKEIWPPLDLATPWEDVRSKDHAEYVLVDTDQKFSKFFAELSKQKTCALDTETTGLNPIEAELVGVSFSWQTGSGYYLPFKAFLGQKTLEVGKHLKALRGILQDETVAKYGHNIKYDRLVLRSAGVELAGVSFDTMVASYLLEADRPSHSLKTLGRELLGMEITDITELIGTGKKQISFAEVPLDRAYRYAAQDADMTWRLRELFEPQLAAAGLEKLFYEVEMPLVEVLVQMEHNGIALDKTILQQMNLDLEQQMSGLLKDIYSQAGQSFNVDSPKQLAEVLFDRLELQPTRKTKTSFSTDEAVLAKLGQEHPLPGLVLQYRQLAKLKNTYLDVLPAMVCKKTGRLHASFNQTMAATGRLSSSGPNLQNIPARDELGRQVRAAFVPSEPDNVLLTADYSQIELRVLAHFSRDEQLTQAFTCGQDIHNFVASQVFGVDPADVTPQQRRQAKTVNFGIVYGQTAYGLSQSLGISVAQAQDFIDQYHQRYKGIRRFLDQCVAQAEKTGFVQTILGRRRRIHHIHSSNRAQQALARRMAINTVVQGSAADLMKVAMVKIHRHIKQSALQVKLLLQIHDELVLELPAVQVREHCDWIRQCMCQAIPLSVPVVVDIGWGKNWLEGK